MKNRLRRYLVLSCFILIANSAFSQLTITGVVEATGGFSGTISTVAQPFITSVGTLSSLNVSGTISAGTLSVTTLSGITSLSVSGALTGSTLGGTISTVAQPNITSLGTLSGLTVAGTVDINTNNNSTVSINTGSSTGTITLGSSSGSQNVKIGAGAGTATVNIADGVGGNTVSIANGINTSPQTINIGAGANAQNNTIHIGDGTNTAGVTAVTIGSNTNLANTTIINGGNGTTAITLTPQTAGAILIGASAGTGTITLGSSSASQIVNVGTGTGAATINIGTGATNSNTINIGTGAVANQILIGNSTTGTNVGINQASPTAQVHLGAGKVTANEGSPLKFTTGSSLSVAEAGAMEYDGTAFYTSPVGSGRGVSPSQWISVLSAGNTIGTLTAGTAVTVFPAGQQTFTVVTGTTYYFEGKYRISQSANTSHTLATLFLLAGGGVAATIDYIATGWGAAANTTATANNNTAIKQTTATVVTGALNAVGFEANIFIKGILRVTGGGTITPQIQSSATITGTNTVLANSYFMLYPLGNGTVTTVGPWQ
ncbi:MAG: hypothetical protein ABIS69_10070 [Sediminibacterium sp.]